MLKSKLIPAQKVLIALGVIALALSVGCTGSKSTKVAEATKNQILLFGNGTEPADLDPHIVTGVPEHHLIAALFEGLVGEDPVDLHPVPGMAESWTVSKDQKVYTFKIRAEAKWSNGDPFTAKDFEYSWKRILSPALGAEYAYMLHVVKGAKDFNEGKLKDFAAVGAKAKDPQTFEVTLESPTPYFLSLLQHYSTFPVHQATIEKFGKMDERGTKWTRPENIVANGPFKLKTWEINKIIEVAKNPNYWDASTVKLTQIHFFPTDSEQTEERSFRAGDLHVTNTVPINKIEVYQKENPELIRIDPYLGTYYYRVNVTKPPFNNKLVRQAFSLSLDREIVVKKITKGGQLPAVAFTPPGTAGYTARAKIEYNLAKAKELLAKAGYPNGQGFPKAEILYNTNEAHKVIAEALQQMWKKELNVELTLTNQDWKVYLDSQKNLNYNLARAGWIGDYPDPNTFLDMFLTGGGNNQTGWSNKQYDALIAQASRTVNFDDRNEVFQKAEAILLEEMPVIPIYTYTRVKLLHPDVKNWHPTILDHHPYKHVYLEASGKDTKVSSN
jgi:oligopeptide transport system substrate-binding protein